MWLASCVMPVVNLSLTRESLAQSDIWYFDPQKWPIYRRVIQKAQARDIPFAVGGGFAHMAYTGCRHDPKDIDFFILSSDREAMVQITIESGLHDYYDEKPYDRAWIYRAVTEDVIVDLIWAMANKRATVDRAWVEQGPEIQVDGVRFRLTPPEELLWAKLYVIQRDRCDWPDALNLVYTCGSSLDWRYVLARLGDDRPLLGSVLYLVSRGCPCLAHRL